MAQGRISDRQSSRGLTSDLSADEAKASMADSRRIVQAPEVDIRVVTCAGEVQKWSGEEEVDRFAVVMVSAGMFRREVHGVESVVDSVAAYVQCRGDIQRVAHPNGGDVCTVIVPSEPILGALGDPSRLARSSLIISPAVDLAHRMLLARAGHGAEEFELIERATVLAGDLIDPECVHGPTISAADRLLAARVRENLETEAPDRLVDLARENGASAYRLSRAFRRVTGLSLTSYRSQLRLRAAMARIAAGDRNLAGIAADVGFADQAHLTRTLRAYAGVTPGAIRSVLAPLERA
jgi:AraC-like DNA-binding protein